MTIERKITLHFTDEEIKMMHEIRDLLKKAEIVTKEIHKDDYVRNVRHGLENIMESKFSD